MWLIAGLGNPGPRYRDNRHSIGFKVVDELARRSQCQGFRSKHGGELATVRIAGQSAILLKPMEYMNLSGFAVQRASAFHKVPVEEIIVVHDEIDLDFARLRLKKGGGHGGNNGVRSIIEQLGTRDFARVRVGIGKPQRVQADGAEIPAAAGDSDRRVSNWVLSDFPADQQDEVDTLIASAADAVECIIAEGMKSAMNKFNAKPKPIKQTKQTKQTKRAEQEPEIEPAPEPRESNEPS